MSNFEDLKSVLCEALENKGVLNQLKSKLRAEIFEILEDNSYEKPRVSQENLLINELIREYMDFNSYKYSKSVFLKESNQPSEPLSRDVIAAELHIQEDKTTRQVPLIYSLLWHFLNNDQSSEQIGLPHSQPLPTLQQTSSNEKSSIKDTSRKIQIYNYAQKFE